jgi:ATP-dependent helicase HrpB
MHANDTLPVDEVLPGLKSALADRGSAVLVAPPGAGKTTRVPAALLGEPWLGEAKVLVLEPRRIAARAAAEHMAWRLGRRLGETVGLRTRLATSVGPGTRIEFVTEGIFTRLILDDPGLAGIGAVIFDEFHERSIDADFGLVLALDARAALRPDLRLLVMSATLDASPVAALLGDAPLIKSEGRAFPIDTRYLGRSPDRIERQMTAAILAALRADTGSILAFLPGLAEIRRTAADLEQSVTQTDVSIVPLHGGLDQKLQQEAIAPAREGHRKVVLATSVAETSITIEGVRIVIDCGLQRVPRYDPDAEVTRLETVRVSRASAEQRRGRAGRTEPGVCYRLWSEPETQGLLPFTPPEIRSADLSGLLLDCAAWGETDVARLAWLDTPPPPSIQAARDQLHDLGALDEEGRITAMGRRMRALPMPPRLARMMLLAADEGSAREAAEIAALIVERGLGGNDTDIDVRLANFRRDRSQRAETMRRMADRWAREARQGRARSNDDVLPAPALLALAYPQRIAKARGERGRFLLANGRAAQLNPADPLAQSPYLMVAELSGTAANARILLAAAASEADVLSAAGDRIVEQETTSFDPAAAAVRVRIARRLGAIELSSDPRPAPPDESTARALARGVAGLGLDRLPWSKAQLQLRHRVSFVHKTEAKPSIALPDLSDDALAATVEDWLAPFLVGRTRLADISAEDLANALDHLIPWDVKRRLDTEVPTHFEAPTGNRHPIDYDSEQAPAVSLRVQELFGVRHHPAIANGRLPLTLMLLAPSGRPLQITRDLPRFWSGSWADVRSEMRGRYPKHPWPDDPANAAPTARAKPRPR